MNKVAFSLQQSDSHMGYRPPSDQPATVVDFERLVRGLRRQKWVFVGWVFVMLILSIAVTVTTPPTYRATATLMLIRDGSVTVDALGMNEALTDDAVDTAEQVFRSRALALQVTDRLDLSNDVRFMAQPVAATTTLIDTVMETARTVVDGTIDFFVRPVPVVGAPPLTPEQEAEVQRQAAARSLQSTLEVRRLGQSTALNVGFNMHDPELAARIVNAYAESYVSDQLASGFERRAQTTEWLQQRLGELEADAREAAIAVQSFRAENDLVTVRDTLVSEGNVDRFNIELSQARTEAARIRARVAAYEAALAVEPAQLAEDDNLRLSLPGDAQINVLRDTLGNLRSRRAEVIRDFGPDHPQVDILNRRAIDAAQRLYAEMERQVEVERGSLDVAESQVASLQDALDPVLAINADASRAQVELRILEQREQSLARLYEAFLIKLQEAGQLVSFPISNVRILTAADVPLEPIAPSKRRAVMLALLLGVFFATLHAVKRELSDRGVRTGSDVMGVPGLPFLGYLPSLRSRDKLSMRSAMEQTKSGRGRRAQEASQALLRRPQYNSETLGMPVIEYPMAALSDPNSLYCETLRRVRNAVCRSRSGQHSTVLGMTSLRSGEGKTFVVTDLADIFALQNGPTLVLDCDFRRLSLSHAIKLDHGASIENVLSGQVDWRDLRVRVAGTEVDILAWDTSVAVGKPSDILGSSEMQELIGETRNTYANVVLDLAAIGPTVDVRELAPAIDQVVLLAQWGQTTSAELQTTLRSEPDLHDRLVGVVMNRVKLRALRQYPEPMAQDYSETYGT